MGQNLRIKEPKLLLVSDRKTIPSRNPRLDPFACLVTQSNFAGPGPSFAPRHCNQADTNRPSTVIGTLEHWDQTTDPGGSCET